ncbi:ice-binding family protein [Paludibaculum fermentans]|uniref:DUF3494 domain-containing protein n=1 Tax=Paludibaculum fermentans TaxID=1473598 RepID=A0A7S7NVP3_PALFE|nr:ice-binding family protein [Paludibaculum fermentans]QOY90678.1 DUF3494 domain-containing protein [Paludibaculum fermentans]
MQFPFTRPAAKLAGILPIAALLLCPYVASGAPILGSAQTFAVFGYAGVTNAHVAPNANTLISGDLGVSISLAAITGFPPGTLTDGAMLGPGSSADQALADANSAAGYLLGLSMTSDLSLSDLGNRTLTAGVYHMSDPTALLTGKLVLDAEGDPNAHFVFQLDHALTTAAASEVQVIHGGPGTQVYWVLGSSATLGAGSAFAGNILAYASVSLGANAHLMGGRVFARSGAVTLIDNFIASDSASQDFGSYGFSGRAPLAEIPEPGTASLLLFGLTASALLRPRSGLMNLLRRLKSRV